MVRSFFILWNGSEETFNDRASAIAATAEGKALESDWSFGQGFNNPQQGDLVYLLRTGKSRGIVASGVLTASGVDPAPHWSEPGKDAWYVDLAWTAAVPDEDMLSAQEVAEAIPEFKFPVQSSGRLIYEPDASLLANRWDQHLDDLSRDHGKPYLGGRTRAGVQGEPEVVPLESRNAKSYQMEGTVSREAVRRESDLVHRFQQHLTAAGGALGRYRIATASGSLLFSDAYDSSSDTLYEAKADAGRNAIRLALGQLLDYRRYFKRAPQLAVLVPSRPEADLLALLREHSIGCVYEISAGEFERA